MATCPECHREAAPRIGGMGAGIVQNTTTICRVPSSIDCRVAAAGGEAAVAADRARIAQAIREEMLKHDGVWLMGHRASRALTAALLRVVEGG